MTKQTVVNPLKKVIVKRSKRLWSLDMLRGAVIVLMALDHVRHIWASTPFDPTDLSQTSVAWFFSRWVTHFCAPVFIFLAGTSAFLYGHKLADPGKLSRWLLTRGIWLVAVELLIVNPGMIFGAPWVEGFFLLQVIWAIGWSMIALAVLVHLPFRWIAGIGLTMVAGHNLLDGMAPEHFGAFAWLWQLLHVGDSWISLGEGRPGLYALYPLIPWVGVMALGYVFGKVMTWETGRRKRWLWRGGVGLLLLFVTLRFTNWYGDPQPWAVQDRAAVFTLLSFLNVFKYPPSLLYLCLTLGAALLSLAWLEDQRGAAARVLRTFGRVPFFFYVVHFPLINLGAYIYHYLRYGYAFKFLTTPQENWPAEYEASFLLMLLIWGIVSVLMYFLCKWYEGYKFRHDYWWLKYL